MVGGKASDQLAFALVDPVYLGLRSGRAVAGISFRFDFEKQIQTSEITHEALTNKSIAVRIRSPLSPAATHTGFQVIVLHTTSVNKVEMPILRSFSRGEGSADNCRLGLSKSR